MHIILNLFSLFLSVLPKQIHAALASLIARILFDVLRIRRAKILSNLEIVYGESKTSSEKKRIGYLSVYHFVLTMVEFLAERNGMLGQNVEIVNEDTLCAVMAKQQGAYILCIHMGSWEAMGAALTRKGYPANVIVKKVGSPKIDAWINKQRAKNGFFAIERKKKGDVSRKITQTLKKNELVGFVMDQARPGEPLLPFFKRAAKTNTSFAAILAKQLAPVIPVYITRIAVGQHRIHVMEPIDLNDCSDLYDPISLSMRFNQIVESMILQCPEQYFWMHDRWKS